MNNPTYNIAKFALTFNGLITTLVAKHSALQIPPGVHVREFVVRDDAGLTLNFRYVNADTRNGGIVGLNYSAAGTFYVAVIKN